MDKHGGLLGIAAFFVLLGMAHANVITDRTFSGVIDATGTVRAGKANFGCSYDFVWRKVSK